LYIHIVNAKDFSLLADNYLAAAFLLKVFYACSMVEMTMCDQSVGEI